MLKQIMYGTHKLIGKSLPLDTEYSHSCLLEAMATFRSSCFVITIAGSPSVFLKSTTPFEIQQYLNKPSLTSFLAELNRILVLGVSFSET